MAFVAPLTRSLVLDALTGKNIRHQIDDDGDVKITFGRDKGKDVVFFVFNPVNTSGFLVATAMVTRFFSGAKLPDLIVFCNAWNRDKRMPRAYVAGPDSDGDFTVRLDMQILCERGVHQELVEDNLSFFFSASIAFWDSLDEVT